MISASAASGSGVPLTPSTTADGRPSQRILAVAGASAALTSWAQVTLPERQTRIVSGGKTPATTSSGGSGAAS